MAGSLQSYLRKHTEALVKDVGIEAARKLSGKSKATLGRYYSDADEHADRFMPVDTVALLEAAATHPHVTAALAELRRSAPGHDPDRENALAGVSSDVTVLSRRFTKLLADYWQTIDDGAISINETKRLLRETVALQKVLIDMKLHLEDKAG